MSLKLQEIEGKKYLIITTGPDHKFKPSELYQFFLNNTIIDCIRVVVEGAKRGLSKEVVRDLRLMELYFESYNFNYTVFEFFCDKPDTFSYCMKTFNYEVNLIMSFITSMVYDKIPRHVNYVGTPFFKFMYDELFSL